MFAHLSRPAPNPIARMVRERLALSLLGHALVLLLVWQLPARSSRAGPGEAAQIINLFTFPVPETETPPAPAPAPAMPDLAAPAETETETEEVFQPIPEDPSTISDRVLAASEVPEPRLSLEPELAWDDGTDPTGVGGPATAPTAPALDPFLPVAAPTLTEFYGSGVPPEALNGLSMAKLLSRAYPRSLLARGVGGDVKLRFVVDREGRVEPGSITVLSYEGEEFALLTVRYLHMLRFRPGYLSGRPVRVSVEMPVRWMPGMY